MKTFKEFLEEAYLAEMRKEDKVKGKKKTPLYLTQTRKTVEKKPEGGWKVKKIENKVMNPVAQIGRFKQGKQTHGEELPRMGYHPHPHGEGGIDRGKKKVKGSKDTRKPRYGEPGWDYKTPAEKVANRKARAGGYQIGMTFGRR